MSNSSTHFDHDGSTRMVKISDKIPTNRRAVSKSRIRMAKETMEAIVSGRISKKGDVLEVARLAGIMASKQTSQLIPLCHQVPLESVRLTSKWLSDGELEWTAEVDATWKTGVEMEALVAVSIAALTVYDMCKSIDRSMEVIHIGLHEKSGGKSGHFVRET